MRGSSVGRPLAQFAALIVTLWLCSHTVYVADEAYRSSLRAVWKARHGQPVYRKVLTEEQMVSLHGMKRRQYLQGHDVARASDRPWAKVEGGLETALQAMFERTDPMKAWELKKLGNLAWQEASRNLKTSAKKESSARSPAVQKTTQVLVYNRLPKSGSSLLLELLYTLGARLGFLVVRGKYHSYRYFGRNDRAGLGYFLEQAAGRARTVYVQHQYYVNFTQPPHRLSQPLYVNMIRDPVEHLMSSYFYKRTVILQHRNPSTFTQEEREVMEQPFEQCVVERRLECVYYGYTVHTNKTEQLEFRKSWSPSYLYPSDVLLYFCGHDPECSLLGSKAALQKAKENVDRHFVVVGVLELLEESLAVLEDQLPDYFLGAGQLYRDQQGQVVNKNLVRVSSLSSSVREELASRLAPEYELYQHIRKRLLEQHAKIQDRQGAAVTALTDTGDWRSE